MSAPSTPANVFAIVPAAGRSRRMGRADKQLLEIDGVPMLMRVVEPLVASRVAGVAIVTRRAIVQRLEAHPLAGQRLATWARERGEQVFFAYNEDAASEMIDSVRIGLREWRARRDASDEDGWLVCPADQPGITTDDIDACIAAFCESPDRIVLAARAGRRGHPMIFPCSLTGFVESSDCNEGLNLLSQVHARRVRLVECLSPGVLRDIDTPADLDRHQP